MKKLVEWARLTKTRGANKEKPARPDTAILFPPTDTTRAGFLLNAMGCETLGGRTQYFNLPEVEMADGLCGGHKQVSHMLRNIYDRAKAGAMRATADGVTGNPVLRVCMTISSTPVAARDFYKNELFNGTFGQRHLRTNGLLLQATWQSQRTHTSAGTVQRRVLQEAGRVSGTARPLQGTLRHPSAEQADRQAGRGHGLDGRPDRR